MDARRCCLGWFVSFFFKISLSLMDGIELADIVGTLTK